MSAAALTGLPAAGCLAPLGSAASMLLRSLSAVSQSFASKPMVAVLLSFVGFAFGGMAQGLGLLRRDGKKDGGFYRSDPNCLLGT